MKKVFFMLMIAAASISARALTFPKLPSVYLSSAADFSLKEGELYSCPEITFKAASPYLTGIFNLKQSKLSVTGLQELTENPAGNLNYSFGLKADVKVSRIKVQTAAGNLSIKGALSRMKRPYFIFSAPVTKPSSPLSSLDFTLPQSGSASQPLSFFISLKPSSIPLESISFSMDKDRNVSSAVSLFFNTDTLQSQIALTAACQKLKSPETSSWFMERKYFPEAYYFFLNGEMNFTFPHLRTFFSAGINENPYGKPGLYFRNQTFIPLKNSGINTAFYISSPDLMTLSGTFPEIKYQLMADGSTSFSINKARIQASMLFLENFRHGESWFYESTLRSKVKIYAYPFQYDCRCSLVYSTENDFPEVSAAVSASRTSPAFSWKTNASIALKQTAAGLSLTESFSPAKSVLKSVSGTADINIKNSAFNSAALKAEITFGKRSRSFTWNGKLTFSAVL